MPNSTFYSLSLKFQLSRSPYFTRPSSSIFHTFTISRSSFSNFFSPFFFQESNIISTSFIQTNFQKFLSTTLFLRNGFYSDFYKQEIRTAYRLEPGFITILSCKFTNIRMTQTTGDFSSSAGCLNIGLCERSTVEIIRTHFLNCFNPFHVGAALIHSECVSINCSSFQQCRSNHYVQAAMINNQIFNQNFRLSKSIMDFVLVASNGNSDSPCQCTFFITYKNFQDKPFKIY